MLSQLVFEELAQYSEFKTMRIMIRHILGEAVSDLQFLCLREVFMKELIRPNSIMENGKTHVGLFISGPKFWEKSAFLKPPGLTTLGTQLYMSQSVGFQLLLFMIKIPLLQWSLIFSITLSRSGAMIIGFLVSRSDQVPFPLSMINA